MIIKIDLKKAYDRLEWSFIDKALEVWGFSMDFWWMIRSCVSSVNFSLLLNGTICGSFKPERGIHEGDPLSPSLFILCFEFLTRILAKEEEQGWLHGIKVAHNAPAISHLMYADDLLIMCPAEAKIIKNCLHKYCSWSGQALNADKSNILFSKSTPRSDRRLIRDTLGFRDMGSKAVYLGNSLVLGRNKTKEFFRLKEKVNCRLEGWNKHLLSKAGKATLIKSVLQAIPSYIMTTHLLPTGICDDLDALVRKFWWKSNPKTSGYLALKAWKDICKPKDLGGLGFRRFKDINLSLLAKLGWKLANREDCL
ncbi:hypothetical protein FEM48_Zijuj10G0002700 [Ziziphus jujuba var. spinosa]|uniref:Reverse transcriptase domain-containing protein n=1 Tax=Ziziphus jujuba var. spinosa TaxID=714518 RepID=A0A978UK56_ZIZJJ|nr:hypothetical protein FEM48_Zijuj10G0002700 [Ziziphus jujuba var. spinosa]